MTDRSEFLDAFAALSFERQLHEFLADIERPPQAYPSWLAFRIKAKTA